MTKFRSRIAPTPSGFLHPGNGVSFIMTWALAKANKGHLLLRIDDLDKTRFRQAYLDDIFFTLEWLGIDYNEGPSGSEDFLENWSQHLRLPNYYQLLHKLREQDMLFACNCSRKQVREQSANGLYGGHCLSQKLPFEESKVAWRVKVAAEQKVAFQEWRQKELYEFNLAQETGHFVVRQKNEFPAYQIASLADDLHFDINFIVRGKDLLNSTAAQVYLANLLPQKAFTESVFWHHDLWTLPTGEKLSKSKGAGSLKEWREAGRNTDRLFQQAARWLGLSKPVKNKEDLLEGLSSL